MKNEACRPEGDSRGCRIHAVDEKMSTNNGEVTSVCGLEGMIRLKEDFVPLAADGSSCFKCSRRV